METKIEYNGSVVKTIPSGNKAILPIANKKMKTDIVITVPESEEFVLQSKTVTTNGEVTADEGYDGLSKVTVNVPSKEPKLISKSITKNGAYKAIEELIGTWVFNDTLNFEQAFASTTGEWGGNCSVWGGDWSILFFRNQYKLEYCYMHVWGAPSGNEITVIPINGDFTDEKTVYENGTWKDVSFKTITIVADPKAWSGFTGDDVEEFKVFLLGNATKQDDTSVDGYSEVIVNVPSEEPNLIRKTISKNGTYKASEEGIIGTWVFNDEKTELDVPYYAPLLWKTSSFVGPTPVTVNYGGTQNIRFSSSTTLDGAKVYKGLWLQEYNELPYLYWVAYTTGSSNGVTPSSLKSLTIGEDFTEENGYYYNETFYDWLKANATKTDSITTVDGYSEVIVTVEPALEEITITENGEYTPSGDGYSKVVVNVASGGGDTDNALDAFIEGSLTEVVLPNATKIKQYAFYKDTTIQNVEMPNVTSIGGFAFDSCSRLALTSLPSGLTSIGKNAFFACTNLTLTELPSGITSIAEYAFRNCYNLALTELPSGITSIGDYTFNSCEKLVLTSLPSGITSITMEAFARCYSLALTSLPSRLKNIGTYAFRACSKLALTELPSSITHISNGAFNSCIGLTTLTFKGKPLAIANDVFQSCTNLTTINVPWAEGEVANAPWGATNATINYNYTGE